MVASVVVALNEPGLAARVVSDLIAADYPVLSVPDSLAAFQVLKATTRLRVLVTSIEHGAGKLTGLALACSAKVKRRQLDVVFVDAPQLAATVQGIGMFLSTPVDHTEIAVQVIRLLTADIRCPAYPHPTATIHWYRRASPPEG
jgi:hypothetical protein